MNVEQRGTKTPAVRSEKGRDVLRRRCWNTVSKNNVATYTERWMSERDAYGVIKRSACGHERCGRKSLRLMKLCDSTVDTVSEAKIVRVDDESRRHRI